VGGLASLAKARLAGHQHDLSQNGWVSGVRVGSKHVKTSRLVKASSGAGAMPDPAQLVLLVLIPDPAVLILVPVALKMSHENVILLM